MVKQWEAESIAIQRHKARTIARRAWRRRIYGCLSVCVLAYGGLFGWWMHHSGELLRIEQAMQAQWQRMVMASGLTVQRVKIDGLGRLDANTVVSMAEINPNQLIFAMPLQQLQQRLEAHPQIASANVERRLPDAIEIAITEREPAVLWQHEGARIWLDKQGVQLPDGWQQSDVRYPVMTGVEADKALPALWALLGQAPEIREKLQAAQWVGKRRWNIWLENGMHVMLPAENPQQALAQLQGWQQDYGLLGRAVTVLDLRIAGMAYVRFEDEVSPEGKTPLLTASLTGAI